MRESQQIAAVYLELRRALPGDLSPRLLMACAASLTELFSGAIDEPAFELRSGFTPFGQWSLDSAFADGGWRVLAHERHTDLFPDEDELDAVDVRKVISRMEMEAYA